MNFFQWIFKNLRLDDNNEIDLKFAMTTMCVWGAALSFCNGVFCLVKGLDELFLIMVAIFINILGLLLYCRNNTRRAYIITYIFLSVDSVVAHFFTTYYLGGSETVFLVIAALLAPHMYPILKPKHTFWMDMFLLAAINLTLCYSLFTEPDPEFTNLVKYPYRIVLANCGIFTCLYELYINISSQDFIRTSRQKLIDKASEAAVLDVLTGLGNRRMLEQCRAEFEQTCSDESPLCLAILDIDFFKEINDTFGHTVGDKVLEFTANTMKDFFRKNDLLIRWGGEEFLVLLRHTGFKDAAALMETFRIKIQNMPMVVGGQQIHINLTIGLKEHRPNTSIDDSIKKADELMYQGKLQGRNRIVQETK